MASGVTASEDLPSFPQTALVKLAKFLAVFPPPHSSVSTPAQLVNLLLVVHPSLSYVAAPAWRSLETAFDGAGLGEWVNGVSECDPTAVGLAGEGIWGWVLSSIERSGERTANVTFMRGGVEKITIEVAAGPLPFASFPLNNSDSLLITPRFEHLLTSLFQLHALKDFDISILPPSSSLQSSSSSTTILISTFASLLGYALETIHLYKELSGRELIMRRVVESGVGKAGSGTTSWEPSPMIKGAWEGKLVHLEGIDTIGATVGSLGRILAEREGELWEGKRIVGGDLLTDAEVSTLSSLSVVDPGTDDSSRCRKYPRSSLKLTRRSGSSPRLPSHRLLVNGSVKSSPVSSSPSRRSRWNSRKRRHSSSRPTAPLTSSTSSRPLQGATDVRTRVPAARVGGWARQVSCASLVDSHDSPTRTSSSWSTGLS